MKKLLSLLLLVPALCWGQSYPNPTFGGATGSTQASNPRTIGAMRADVINVKDCGAAGDGVTNDSAAIQTCINLAASSVNVSGSPLSVRLVFPEGQYRITTALSFTAFTSFGNPQPWAFTVDMEGACLIGQTSGTPVIDALGSRMIYWHKLCIYGSATNTPNIGMQIGRYNETYSSADYHYFNDPVVLGSFTFTAFYNFASEVNTYVDGVFSNSYATGTPYAYVADGANH